MTKKQKQEMEDQIICNIVNQNLAKENFTFGECSGKQVVLRFLKYQMFENFGLQLYIEGEPYATITVNIEPMQYREFCVDVNNFPEALKFLYENGIAEPTDEVRRSGYCVYPVWKLNEKYFDGVKEALEKLEKQEEAGKYRNACGSCKYFEQAEFKNKVWRTCPKVYKRGMHAGKRRTCCRAMTKCCDYVRKESEVE